MACDLHTHTTFSDGALSPEELLSEAQKAHLHYLAITDHDTVDGVAHLYEKGVQAPCGLTLIPGVEFSAHWDEKHEVHILGYGLDIYQKDLNERLNDVREARWARLSEMLEKLKALHLPVSEAEVLRIAGTSQSVSRSHVARALVKKGYCQTVREAFDKALAKGRPAYVPHYRLTPQEIVQLVKGAGGIPVLAHPKLVGDDQIVQDVLSVGLEGLEVYYPQHDAVDTERYLAMANARGLLVTGGSDFHGYVTRYPSVLGVFTAADTCAQKLLEAIQGQQNHQEI